VRQQHERDDDLRRLRRHRDDPLQEQVRGDPEDRARAQHRLAERHGRQQDHERRVRHQRPRPAPAPLPGKRRELGRDAQRLRTLTTGRRDPAQVHDVHADQYRRVEQRQPACHHRPRRPPGGDRQDRQLDPVRGRQLQWPEVQPPPATGEQHDDRRHRDGEPEQQAAGSRQVRGDVLRVPEKGEVHLDEVLRQDGDERHDGDHQPVGDVDLRRLAGPGEQEGSRHDGRAVRNELQRVVDRPAAEPDQQAGGRPGRRDGEGPLPGLMRGQQRVPPPPARTTAPSARRSAVRAARRAPASRWSATIPLEPPAPAPRAGSW
jgi:hypothetical protein